MRHFIAVDVGGTAIKFALVNEQAEILEKGEIETPKDSLETFVETIGQIYDLYAAHNPEALVMSAPGRIDSTNGYFYTGGALQYIHETDMAKSLEKRVPIPFCVENDAKAAALAELWKGSMRGIQNGLVLVLGTGIGGALIIDGKLYRGSTFAAGEVSGIPVNLNSRTGGNYRNWANINGTYAMVEKHAFASGLNPKTHNGRKFFEAALDGDEKALQELDWYCETMMSALLGLQLILDVEKVAFGGGISQQPLLIDTLRRKNDEMYDRIPFYIPAHKPLIDACTFTSDANLVGALYHYLYEIENQPKSC